MEGTLSTDMLCSRTAGNKFKWQQWLVLRMLKQMQKGYLEISLTDGELIRIGDPLSGHKARIRILNPAFFNKCVFYGDVGFGESYVDGDWETDDITRVINWFILNIDNSPTISGSRRRFAPLNILKSINRWYHRSRENTLKIARRNISEHYDLSNDFFRLFLDPGMTYSSGHFNRPDQSLEEAQSEKYDRLCRQLQIKATDHVLEIGSGWGGFAVHVVKNYGCKITTITISEQQFQYAKDRFEKEGLSDKITILLTDYRKLTGQFDKIVSIEMLEAVGHKYLESYFAQCHALLKADGILGLQVITCPDTRYDSLRKNVDWIQKHIFPGSLLPSIAALNQAINRTGELNLIDLKNMGHHYARTLAIWRENFNRNKDHVKKLGFDSRFIRKWNYYFSYCEAAFYMRNISVVQMIYTRPNNIAY
ncbi:class I SAM-dependent methyltransferase [bacterium]|nr:MAG: class I SAM-dependent methyltransferase [bacterium]